MRWSGCREGGPLIREEFLVKGKEEVKYISEGQGMKLGQRVSALNNSKLLECTEFKCTAEADELMLGF